MIETRTIYENNAKTTFPNIFVNELSGTLELARELEAGTGPTAGSQHQAWKLEAGTDLKLPRGGALEDADER